MRANGYIMVMLRPLRIGLAGAAVLASAAVACGGGAVDTDTGAGGSPTGVGGTASGGAGSGVGGTGTGGGEVITLPGGLELEGSPQYYRVVRLTHVQWENSVREVLRLPEESGLSSGFITDPPDGKFSNNERALYISDTLWDDYRRSAETLAKQVATNSTALGLLGSAGDAAGFIASVGERAFRRALTSEEVADYQALWNQGATFIASGNDFADGAQVFLEALLQSPHFLYRIELSPADARLSGPELATKLSFLLRDAPPDDELMQAALAGTLDTNAGLASVVSDMLDEDSAAGAASKFHRELFGLDRYASILKSPTTFPQYDESMNQMFFDADIMFFARIYEEDFGLREILLSDVAYVNSTTASIYGLTAQGSNLTKVTLDGSRPGFLTRAGFLAYNGSLSQPDPIHRGVDINNRLLCAKLSPPAGTIPPLPDPIPGQTNRERVEAHTGDGFCGSCHNTIINPPGFALETFDALGRTRTMDNNKPIDTTGTFAVMEESMSFTDIEDLTTQLAESPIAHACYVANLTEFALARDLGTGEVALLTSLQAQSKESDASVKNMLLTMLQSPEFTNAKAAP